MYACFFFRILVLFSPIELSSDDEMCILSIAQRSWEKNILEESIKIFVCSILIFFNDFTYSCFTDRISRLRAKANKQFNSVKKQIDDFTFDYLLSVYDD